MPKAEIPAAIVIHEPRPIGSAARAAGCAVEGGGLGGGKSAREGVQVTAAGDFLRPQKIVVGVAVVLQ